MHRTSLVLAAALFVFGASAACAHPHVWVTMRSEVVYAADGTATAIRHAWRFDEAFSRSATQDVPPQENGQYTQGQLARLATDNIEMLKEHDYFNYAFVDGARKKGAFADPIDGAMDYRDGALTLNFTLPFKTPAKARTLRVEIYDPEFFTAFQFASESPVKLSGAPAACALALIKPDASKFPSQPRADAATEESSSNEGRGALFASKISVTCP